MRMVALVVVGACGGQPALANAPRPDPGAVAGVAAAAAAAITLANPNAAGHKPEKHLDGDQRAVEVKETVPTAVFDRLDNPPPPEPTPAPAPTAPKRKGPGVKLPSPRDAVDPAR